MTNAAFFDIPPTLSLGFFPQFGGRVNKGMPAGWECDAVIFRYPRGGHHQWQQAMAKRASAFGVALYGYKDVSNLQTAPLMLQAQTFSKQG